MTVSFRSNLSISTTLSIVGRGERRRMGEESVTNAILYMEMQLLFQTCMALYKHSTCLINPPLASIWYQSAPPPSPSRSFFVFVHHNDVCTYIHVVDTRVRSCVHVICIVILTQHIYTYTNCMYEGRGWGAGRFKTVFLQNEFKPWKAYGHSYQTCRHLNKWETAISICSPPPSPSLSFFVFVHYNDVYIYVHIYMWWTHKCDTVCM